MNRRKLAAGSLALAGILPVGAAAAPSVYFAEPDNGEAISGWLSGSECEARGSNIRYVRFYMDNKQVSTDTRSPWNCSFDTRDYSDGTHSLRVVAYDSSGRSASRTVSVNVRNRAGSGSAPTVSFTAPASGGALSGNVQGPPNCIVTGSNIARVMFYINGVWTNTDGNLDNGLGCWIDTTKYRDGAYTLKAVAYNSAGQTATATRDIVIRNDGDGGDDGGDSGAPTVSFTAPAVGGALSGNVQGPPNCIVTGSNIARVMFYINGVWTNTDGNLDNGLGCWIDTTRYRDGAYTLKAVAYNSAGLTASATRDIVIRNGSSGGDLPTVSFSRPTSGATVSGNLYQSPSCEVKGTGIQKVQFYLGSTALNTELSAPYLCNFDTTKFANGSHTLMAVASNAAGSTSTQVSVKIDNQDDDPGSGDGGTVEAADIIGWAKASVPFSQQSGYNTQVINTYLQASQIPESGIHGSVLSNGESLRLGKQTDPRDSSRKALAFQLSPNDPTTSGSRRAEIKFPGNIQNDRVYWVAFRHYVKDWGTLPTSDVAIIGMQLHSGGSSGLSPAIGVYSRGGRNFWIDARGSTASSPTQSNSVSVRSAERPIQFGRWVDFVVKFKLNTSGKGFVQAWMDGTQIFNHQGTVGYNTGSSRPYFKFGYYNWTSFKTTRKVMLRSPVIVADPTGSKYTLSDLRSHINK
jgi:hypothetical protein